MGIEIKKDRFSLREWRMEDVDALTKGADNFKIWLNLRDVFPYPYTVEDAVGFIQSSGTSPTVFAIDVEGQAVGSIGYFPGRDVERNGAEVGYWLAETFWGNGIMTEAVQVLSDYIFESTEIVRLFATLYQYNPASMRVLEKAGFTLKGSFTKAAYKNGRFTDMLYYEKVKGQEALHFLSGDGVWQSSSAFTDAEGNVSEGTGRSVIKVDNNGKITNHSYADLSGKKISNDYEICRVNTGEYRCCSVNPDLGIQEGTFHVRGSKVYFDFNIRETAMHGFEVIRREGDVCFSDGALYDGDKLINTWSAVLRRETEV